MGIHWVGAIVGLILAIALILKKMPVFFGMMTGAFVGGILGFAIWMLVHPYGTENISQGWNEIISVPVKAMFIGGKGIMTVVLRILASGILTGALIFTGAAKSIALKLIKIFGHRFVFLGLILTSLILTASGVFIDVTVITIAPIALTVAKEAKLSRSAILIALIGGGKVGNIMSPNPNAIAAGEAYNVLLIKVMAAGSIIAIIGIVVTYLIVHFKNERDRRLKNDIVLVDEGEDIEHQKGTPSFGLSILGPVIAILFLVVRPISTAAGSEVSIDPLIALPLGGLVTIFGLGHSKKTFQIMNFGIKRMIPVAVMLAGTGLLSGVIKQSDLSISLVEGFKQMNIPLWILAPFSGILFGFATASTTAGTTLASQAFAPTVGMGIQGAAMTHAGATVLDSMPHGSFFHSTAGSVKMKTTSRMKIIVWEALIGFSLTIASTIIFGIIGLAF